MDRSAFKERIPEAALRHVVARRDTPCYVYFQSILAEQVASVRDCTRDRFDLHYAVKANPHPDILRSMADLGVGADVASAGELRAALAAGIPAADIEFSGPGKRQEELSLAVSEEIGSINVESVAEIPLLAGRAREQGRRARVGVRVNPGAPSGRAGLRMAGDTHFGIALRDVPEALSRIDTESDILDFTGFHAHFASQELDAEAIASNVETLLDITTDVMEGREEAVRKLNFGGGWGIQYFPHQDALDLTTLQARLDGIRSESRYSSLLADTRLIVEPGRFLVGECGVFVARVLYIKQAESKSFAVLDGGMHHNYVLAGGMGQVIRRNFELEVIPEGRAPSGDECTFDVVGPLCTPQDVLATNVTTPHGIEPGDAVVFFNCGAYGPTASPLRFLSHEEPTEVLLRADDTELSEPAGRSERWMS